MSIKKKCAPKLSGKKNPKSPKRTIATFKKAINELCLELRWNFFANNMRMDIHWELDVVEKHPGGQVGAFIEINQEYLWFSLTIRKIVLEQYLDERDEEVLAAIVHEFCHLVIDPLYLAVCKNLSNDAHDALVSLRERQTETMKNILELVRVNKLKEYIK